MKQDLGVGKAFFDLRSLRAGYHLRVTDDSQPTWLPHISRKDFIQNVPTGPGVFFILHGIQPIAAGYRSSWYLPYWVWLVLDREDAQARTFTPRPEQMGHMVWPAGVF